MSNKITAWSYSRLSVYEKCPFQAKCKFIDKIPEEENYAMERGSILHAKAEQFVKGTIRGMPSELMPFKNELKELKRLCADTEIDLSVTKGWNKSHGQDWNNVWCRAYGDAGVLQNDLATIVDHKTGKVYDSHEDQGKLYATCGMVHYPEAKIIDVEFWYFDQNEVSVFSYKRTDFSKLRKYWDDRVKPMFRDTKFLPSPGSHCRWCSFANSKGGPCEEG